MPVAISQGLTQPSAMRCFCVSISVINSACSSGCGGRLRTVRKAKFNRCSSLAPPSVKIRRAPVPSLPPSKPFHSGHQRLQRCVGSRSTHTGDVTIRRVESLQERIRSRSASPCVDRSAITILTSFIDPRKRCVACWCHEQKCRRRWHHRTPTDFGFNNPMLLSWISRTISPSTRKRGPRASRRL